MLSPKKPASYSFVLDFPTLNCSCNHCCLHSLYLFFLYICNELTVIISSVFFLYSIFFLSSLSLLFFPLICLCLFVLLASAQAPHPLHLRMRLCLPPLIGQSVPTLARSVCRPRRRTMQVHSLSYHTAVGQSCQNDFLHFPLPFNSYSTWNINHIPAVCINHCS